jgi:hypothetical protein
MTVAGRVAVWAAAGLFLGSTAMSSIPLALEHRHDLAELKLMVPVFAVLATILGLGTHWGARWASRRKRIECLIPSLGAGYAIIGVAMALPIQTHAVLLDMSVTSSITGNFSAIATTSDLLIATILLSPLLTAVAAVKCRR